MLLLQNIAKNVVLPLYIILNNELNELYQTILDHIKTQFIKKMKKMLVKHQED